MSCATCEIWCRFVVFSSFSNLGWEVLLISEERGRALSEEFGLECRAVAGDSCGIVFEEEHAEMLAKGKLMKMIQELAFLIGLFELRPLEGANV